MTALEKSIDVLYSAFASVPKPETIAGCECCISADEIDELIARELRSIPADLLRNYASSALLTVGFVDDYLYFLPRILEVHVNDESYWPDVEITGRAIGDTDPLNWPAELLAALRTFLFEVIRSLLAPTSHDMIDRWICAIGRMGIPVEPYLDEIAQSPDAVLAYFDLNAPHISKGRLSNAFWEPHDDAQEKIVSWFNSAPIRKIIESARDRSISR